MPDAKKFNSNLKVRSSFESGFLEPNKNNVLGPISDPSVNDSLYVQSMEKRRNLHLQKKRENK